jgi:hypothetical protein
MYKRPSNVYSFGMVRGFRSLFAWTIALALSLSGYASAAMLLCTGMGVSTVQTSSLSATVTSADRNIGSMPMASARGSAVDCTSTAAGVHLSKSPAGDCTGAGCGTTAAPAPQSPAFAVPMVNVLSALQLHAPGVGFFTDAPDRPPRALD